MANYIIGGWSQRTADQPPKQFSVTMYGMITNLEGLTSGTPSSPGWSPEKVPPPKVDGTVMWTYGGGGCTPRERPLTTDVERIVSAADHMGWDGVDFDDECRMDASNIIAAMKALRPKETSYTFLAGWDYNNPGASSLGREINESVRAIAGARVCDRFVLMCYAAAMWSMADIKANVGPALDRTLGHVGDPKKVFLALTPRGLNDENLDYFLNAVTDRGVGGLFVWDFPELPASALSTITGALGIT